MLFYSVFGRKKHFKICSPPFETTVTTISLWPPGEMDQPGVAGLVVRWSGDRLTTPLFPVAMPGSDLSTPPSTVLPSIPLTHHQEGKTLWKESPQLSPSPSPKFILLFLIHFPPLSNCKEKKKLSEAKFCTCHLFLPPLTSAGTLFH